MLVQSQRESRTASAIAAHRRIMSVWVVASPSDCRAGVYRDFLHILVVVAPIRRV